MKILSLDFETYYDSDVSLKKLNTMEYVNHPLFKVHGVSAMWHGGNDADWYSEDEVEEFLESIDWDDTAIICQNTNFDAYILSQIYGIRPAFHYDTMAMARGKWPGRSASLEHILVRLFPDDETMRKGTELSSTKGIRELTPELDEILGKYACNDVFTMDRAFSKLIVDYPEKELKIIDLVVRMFTQPQLVLDVSRTANFREEIQQKAEKIMVEGGVDPTILSSNKQFAEYIQQVLKLQVPMKPNAAGTLIPALGKNDLAFQRLRADNPQHEAIWKARISSKSRIDETRSTRLLDGVNKDGTISMPLRYYAAHTGRFGGGEKLNPQNFRRGSELRKALRAPDGKLLYICDLSQIEARLTAWLAGCDPILNAFRGKRDIYSEFATSVYGRTITKEDKIERFVGKTCILGLGFGVGAQKLKDTLESGSQGPVVKISLDESKRIVNTYRSDYREIPNLWRKLESSMMWLQNASMRGKHYGPLVADHEAWLMPNGMRMQYPQLEGLTFYDERYKMRKKIWGGVVTENVIQALARIVICEAMLLIEAYFHSLGGGVALQVHDELVAVGPEENADEHFEFMLDTMTTVPIWAPDLPLAAEGGYDKIYSK